MQIQITTVLPFGQLFEYAAVEEAMLKKHLAAKCYVQPHTQSSSGTVKGTWFGSKTLVDVAAQAETLMALPGVSRIEISVSKAD